MKYIEAVRCDIIEDAVKELNERYPHELITLVAGCIKVERTGVERVYYDYTFCYGTDPGFIFMKHEAFSN